MAKTFFENFKQAEKIYPGVATGADSDGNIRLGNGYIRNIYLPDAIGDYNTAAYRDRVAVPFTYESRSGKTPKTRSGILYMPAYEADKITPGGFTEDEEAEIYGAELEGASLTREGLQRLFNDKNNSNFKFDTYTARRALNPGGEQVRDDTSRFQAKNTKFMQNLRKALKFGRQS